MIYGLGEIVKIIKAIRKRTCEFVTSIEPCCGRILAQLRGGRCWNSAIKYGIA